MHEPKIDKRTEAEARRLIAEGEVKKAGKLIAEKYGDSKEAWEFVRRIAYEYGENPGKSAYRRNHGEAPQAKNQKRKKHLFALFSVWIIVWGICGAFAYYLYEDCKMHAELTGADLASEFQPVFLGLTATALVASAVWLLGWAAFRRTQVKFDRNQAKFDEGRSPEELAMPLPLSLQENTLRINRGFSIQAFDMNELLWIHTYTMHRRSRRLLMVHFYGKNGKRDKALFDGGPVSSEVMQGLQEIIRKARVEHPGLLYSEGRNSPAFRDCRRLYKNMLSGF